jgi:hypothetical protein
MLIPGFESAMLIQLRASLLSTAQDLDEAAVMNCGPPYDEGSCGYPYNPRPYAEAPQWERDSE